KPQAYLKQDTPGVVASHALDTAVDLRAQADRNPQFRGWQSLQRMANQRQAKIEDTVLTGNGFEGLPLSYRVLQVVQCPNLATDRPQDEGRIYAFAARSLWRQGRASGFAGQRFVRQRKYIVAGTVGDRAGDGGRVEDRAVTDEFELFDFLGGR